MTLVPGFIFVTIAGIILIPFLKTSWRGWGTFGVISVNSLLSGYLAVLSLEGAVQEWIMPGSPVTGAIPVRLDALSGWFILIINLVYITGVYYGLHYMKEYRAQRNELTLHGIASILSHAALVSACVIQNSLAFIIAWEIMTLSAFILVIFDHEKSATIKAGINFLIQSHISVLFLMIGFLWVAHKTGSYDFNAVTDYASSVSAASSMFLFAFFFTGFAIKAGFFPFHTWLPYAHPAAPSHVSGMMSGVIIKIGIFGILRMLLLIPTNYYSLGIIIIIISVVTGLYGVMLAIIQHNLKRLLAYHSIENIGIIGIGIGLGCVGLGSGNQALATLGFAGALLHTLNHALFKSLLFYAAGNVYQAAHTLDIERLGGLVKRMPQTTALFLIAAIAICGIPPFNGFVSEFIIYIGIYNWMGHATFAPMIAAIFAMPGLVLIGGFAMLCFTKAFGVVFLGSPRQALPESCREASPARLLPLYVLMAFIILIGIFPGIFIRLLIHPVGLLTGTDAPVSAFLQTESLSAIAPFSRAMWGLILMVLAVFGLRKWAMRRRTIALGPTWGCGYPLATAKQQYTAGSFVRTYTKLFQFVFQIHKEEKEVKGVFPSDSSFTSHPYDMAEHWLIDKPLKIIKVFMGRFLFLNNGKLQIYILYGIVFILSIISIPLIYKYIQLFIEFVKQL